MAAYKSAYHDDSDADDEYERSVFTSPTLPADFESSPTDSEPPSNEHTPTTFTHSADGHGSPTGLITEWTAGQCADFVIGLGLSQYADTFIDEAINGEALIALQHSDLKDLGMTSVGHRLTVLKSVYGVKVKQNVPLDPDHYVPLSADTSGPEAAPTQDDISRIIHIIKERDARIRNAEEELRLLKEDLNRVSEENRKLREDFLPLVRMAKDRSQPLPTPDDHASQNLQPQEKTGSSLSRKFSTKKLFLGSTPKNPSPTIHEGRTLTDTSSLDPSAAAMAASSHLTASMRDGSQPATSPHMISQPSPTSPAYSTGQPPSSSNRANSSFPRSEPSARSMHPAEDHYSTASTWSTATAAVPDSRGDGRTATTPAPLSARPLRSANAVPADAGIDPPLTGNSINSNSASAAPPITSTTLPIPAPTTNPALTSAPTSGPPGGSSNPQVEIFKSFRVSIDDPCHKVLPVALKKYNITADWRQYALYIVHGDQERCLGLNEKPLILFKQLDREGRKPMFMLRKHASPEMGGWTNVVAGAGAGGGGGGGGMGMGMGMGMGGGGAYDGGGGGVGARGVNLPGGVL